MSMNLQFQHDKWGIISFPYQTTTAVTHRVMNTPTLEGKMAIIEADIRSMYENPDALDIQEIDARIAKIKLYVFDPQIKLVMM